MHLKLLACPFIPDAFFLTTCSQAVRLANDQPVVQRLKFEPDHAFGSQARRFEVFDEAVA